MSARAHGLSVNFRQVSSCNSKFDYTALSASVEKFLRGQADRIRRQCASSIIQIGKALLEAKRHLSHGAFLRWVENEIGIPSRTAQAYMRAAQWASRKSATVAHLPPSAIYLLSSSGVPQKFVADVLERIDAGEQIGAASIRRELKAFLQRESEKCEAADIVVQEIEADYSIVDTSDGSPIAELAAFLSRKLSEPDFALVCQILTSENVLSDRHLAEKLERQFRVSAGGGLTLV